MRLRRARVAFLALSFPALAPGWAADGDRVFRVGVICLGDDPWGVAQERGFIEGLAKLGFTQGRNLVLERSGTNSRVPEALARDAAELVARKVDVLTTWCGSPAALAAKRATSITPVVFSPMTDPVALGMVASLARPGGNLTGFSSRASERGAKTLEALVEVKPGIRHVAVIHHESSRRLPWFDTYRAALEQAGRSMKLSISFVSLAEMRELEPAFQRLSKGGVQAVFVLGGVQTPKGFGQLARSLALKYRLPSAGSTSRELGEGELLGIADGDPGWGGGAMARYVARILRGASPAELPVEQEEQAGLSIDLRLARALGLTIPPALLARATEVIE